MSSAWASAGGWVLHSAVCGGLLLLLAWLGQRLVRQPALRQRLGEWGVLAALAAAILCLAPAWLVISVPVPAAPVPAALAEAPTAEAPGPSGGSNPVPPEVSADETVLLLFDETNPRTLAGPVGAAGPLPGERPPDASEPPPATADVSPANVLLAVLGVGYAVVASVVLGHWLLGHLALWRLLRAAEPPPPDIERFFRSLAPPGTRPRLLTSPRLRVPLSCGVVRPTVVLPAALAETGPSPSLAWVFGHELTHLERRDAWGGLLLGLGQVVFFYLPWFWWLRRQVRLCQEYVADATAAGLSQRPEDYAEFLLHFTAAPPVPAGATGVSGNTSDLFRRVTMLLNSPLRVDKRCPRLWWAAAAFALLALALPLAGVGLRAEAAPAPDDRPKDKFTPAAQTPDDERKAQIQEAESNVQMYRERVAWSERMVQKGYLAKSQVDAERAKLSAAEALLRTVRGDDKKDDPNKDDPKKKGDPKKDDPNKPNFPNIPFPDIDDLLKQLPANIDPEQMKVLRKELEKAREQTKKAMEDARKAMEDARRQIPGGFGGGGGFGGNFGPGGGFAMFGALGDGRLGARVEKPNATLVEQLDLPKGRGLIVRDVQADSAAAKAGLKAHDILLEVGGKAVPDNANDFAKMLEDVKANTPVDVLVLRKGKKETVKGLSLPEAKPGRPGFGLPGGNFFPNQPGGLPGFGGGGAGGGLGGGIGGQGGLGGAFAVGPNAVMTTTFRNDDRFTTRHQEGTLVITVTGTVDAGKARVGSITVQDGNTKDSYESVDKVPEQYRDKVKNLVEISEKGGGKIEIRKNK